MLILRMQFYIFSYNKNETIINLIAGLKTILLCTNYSQKLGQLYSVTVHRGMIIHQGKLLQINVYFLLHILGMYQ